MKSGLNLDLAMEQASSVISNKYIASTIKQSREDLIEGKDFILSLRKAKIFPSLFIQSEGKITHYMKVKQQGPFLREGDEESQISVKDINKVEHSFKSDYKGQGYNKLEHFEVISLLQKLTI